MNTQMTASIQADPVLRSTAINSDILKEVFGDRLQVITATNSDQLNIYRDASQLPPILLTISVAMGVAASIGVKKVVELFAEDVYKSAKQVIKALFKGRSEERREIRLELREVYPMIQARVSSNDPEVIECAISDNLSILADQITSVLEQSKSPGKLTHFNPVSMEEEVLNLGDKLPDNIEWIIFQYEMANDGWTMKSMLTEEKKLFLDE